MAVGNGGPVLSYRDDHARVLEALTDARPSGASTWLRTNCPFCVFRVGKEDRRQCLAVLGGVGIYSCWRCGTSGKLKILPDWFAAMEPAPEAVEFAGKPEHLVPVWPEALCTEMARAYLEGRGIGERMCLRAQIGTCLSGWFADRIIVPVLATDGETWVGFVARAAWDGAEDPYRYPKGMLRGTVLYEQSTLFMQTDKPVLVVEGVMDAIHFPDDAVAVLGKPSHWQVEAIAETRRPVVVVLDGDAHEEGRALAFRLRLRGVKAGHVRLPPRTDPDEVDAGWLWEEAMRSL